MNLSKWSLPSTSLRLLEVLQAETLSSETHINEVICQCQHQLWRIRAIRQYLPVTAAIQLVRAFVLTKIDYYNSVLLFGLPDTKLNHLQSILNLAARIIFGCWWSDHVTPLLRLFWCCMTRTVKII